MPPIRRRFGSCNSISYNISKNNNLYIDRTQSVMEGASERTPRPKSPPEYAGLYGKRRHLTKLVLLEKEISSLQEELKSLDGIQPSSRCCQEVNEFVISRPDPLLAADQNHHKSKCCWKRIWGKPCSRPKRTCCFKKSSQEQQQQQQRSCCCQLDTFCCGLFSVSCSRPNCCCSCSYKSSCCSCCGSLSSCCCNLKLCSCSMGCNGVSKCCQRCIQSSNCCFCCC